MKFRSHLAAYALASVAAALSATATAADTGTPIVLEGHALGGDASPQAKPTLIVTSEVDKSFELRGRLRPDGTVELTCEEAGHGVLSPHEHRDGREEIR